MISPLVELFLEQSRLRPDQEAVTQGRNTLTYRQLSERMKTASGYLHSRGVVPGDRILLFVPPGPDLYALLLATWRIGAAAVFVDAWTSRHRLGQVTSLTHPRLFVGIPKAHLLRLLDAKVRRLPSALWWSGRNPSRGIPPAAEVDPGSTALITFTTGSTGAPKGANRSHSFLLAQHEILQETLGTRPGSIDLATLPIFALHDLAAGATCRFAPIDPARPDSLNSEQFNAQLRESDSSAGSPAVYLAAAQGMLEPDPSVRTHIHLGGAAVFPETISKLSWAYPNATWQAVYGSTEAEPIASIDGHELASWSGTGESGIPAGKPSPAISLRILGPCDTAVDASTEQALDQHCVPNGQVGEIIVSGPHVLERYWNDPEAERRNKIRTPTRVWHRTGDAGHIDEEGNLFLHGRISERITAEGRAWYPMGFERRLRQTLGVSAGCVLDVDGNVLVVIEPVHGENPDILRQRILEQPWPFPVSIHLRPIPRDPRHRSKLDTAKLRDMLR